MKFRNLTFNGLPGGYPAIKVIGGGTLTIENCVFENIPGNALDIEPNGAFNLVMKNSRISNNTAAGVLIKPAAGGSVTVTQTLSESLMLGIPRRYSHFVFGIIQAGLRRSLRQGSRAHHS